MSRLVNRDVIRMFLDTGQPLKHGIDRGTGRTTSIALVALASAIQHPGTWIACRDHFDTGAADRNLIQHIYNIASKLGLEKITFDKAGLRIKSDFAEVLV